MKRLALMNTFTLLLVLGSCSVEDVVTDAITGDEESLAVTKICQTCISKNPEILPQLICDNGDGTFTMNDRTQEFTDGATFERLIRAFESGDRFTCD